MVTLPLDVKTNEKRIHFGNFDKTADFSKLASSCVERTLVDRNYCFSKNNKWGSKSYKQSHQSTNVSASCKQISTDALNPQLEQKRKMWDEADFLRYAYYLFSSSNKWINHDSENVLAHSYAQAPNNIAIDHRTDFYMIIHWAFGTLS